MKTQKVPFRLHSLQHVSFEDIGSIAEWALGRKMDIRRTKLWEGEELPDLGDFDWLVVLGGPMNADEESHYPWMQAEKELILRAILGGKYVMGICLGAQLMARVLGARVESNPDKEIGWFPVTLTEAGRQSRFFAGFPERWTAVHWHGDCFQIPAGCRCLLSSEACDHQAFAYSDKVLGVQCHFEYTRSGMDRMVEYCGHEVAPGKFVQPLNEMTKNDDEYFRLRDHLWRLLENYIPAER
jgi:GMP synthase-like glutamine amidotransferase